jgi:predicted amidohydrolase YtcJ
MTLTHPTPHPAGTRDRLAARAADRAAALASTEPADLVLTGGAVYRLDAARSTSEAIAVRGDRIAAVGDAAAVAALIGPRTRVVDLRGRTVLPGFGDAHVHPVSAGLGFRQCDVRPATLKGADAYAAIVREYAEAHPDLPWIIGDGWYMPDFPGGNPTRGILDAVVADRPVFLQSRDGHSAWVNTRALALAGVTADTADPHDGVIVREPDGGPAGTLHESAQDLVWDVMPRDTPDELVDGLTAGQAYLHSLGITQWQEASASPEYEQAYRTLDSRGQLTARVTLAMTWDHDRTSEQIDELAGRRAVPSSDRLRATSVKIFQDGVIENFTAALIDPYLDGSGRATSNRGMSMVEAEALKGYVTELDAQGFQVHFHAIGDRAVREALDAFDVARTTNGLGGGRHHISHIQLIHPDDLGRFRTLGVAANMQPLWACHENQMDELTLPFLGPERATWQYPFESLRRAGAVLVAGSDWSVSSPDPLLEIELAVNRVWHESRGTAEPFLPEQRLSLPDAIAAFTSGTAWINHLDDETGTLEPGKLADLAVLDRDLFDRGAGEIGEARVVATLVSGTAVHEAAAFDA